MYTMSSGEKMKSASCASTMQRPGVVLRNASVPGPGAYDVKDHMTIEHLPALSALKKSSSGTAQIRCWPGQ